MPYDASIQNPGYNNPFGQIQPTQYQPIDFGATLDNVMNQAIQYKIAQQQLQKGQIEIQNANAQLAAQKLQAASLGYAPEDVLNSNYLNQAMQPQLSNVQNGQGAAAPEDPRVAGLRQAIAAHQAMYRMGIQKEQAGIGATQAEAAQKGSEANLNQAQAALISPNQAGESPINNVGNAVRSGQMSPEFAASGLRNPYMKIGLLNNLATGGTDITGLQSNAQERIQSAETTGGSAVQLPARFSQSLNKALDDALGISNTIPRTETRFLNTPLLKLSSQFGDSKLGSQAMQLNFAIEAVRTHLAKVLESSNYTHDEAVQRADKFIPDNITARQFSDLVPVIKRFSAYNTEGLLQPAQTPKLQPIQRTLKSGKTVNVIPLGNGQFQEVDEEK